MTLEFLTLREDIVSMGIILILLLKEITYAHIRKNSYRN